MFTLGVLGISPEEFGDATVRIEFVFSVQIFNRFMETLVVWKILRRFNGLNIIIL